jgi:simple sugar transport system substrate-binding protein
MSKPRKPLGRLVVGTTVVTAVLLASACGSSGGKSTSSSSGGSSPAAAGSGKGPKIFAIGGKADDPFWSRVKRGADDAGKVVSSQGGSVTWLGPQNYDNLGPDAAKLIQTAISQGATAIVAADWVPEAEDSALQAAVSAKIPLIVYNAGGLDAANKVGALNYVGSDEGVAGKAGGEYFGSHGAKNVLCINTLPGAANSEARCKGVAEGLSTSGGTSKQLPLPSSSFGNPTAVAQAIKAALLKDSSIDGVITISTGDADAAANGISQAGVGDKVKLATFDVDPSQLKRIKSGKELFAIDQQPYMQGYLAVSMLNGYVQWGLNLPQKPILTGPAIIDASNIDTVNAGAAAGVR